MALPSALKRCWQSMLQTLLDGLFVGWGVEVIVGLLRGLFGVNPCRVRIVGDWGSSIERWWSDGSALQGGCRSSVG